MKVGRRDRMVRRTGFTLVELLVVISIIGMLMALLFPAINSARESGRQNTCRSNMRNIAQAMVGYETKKNAYPMFINRVSVPDTTTYPQGINRSLMFVLLPELERSDIYNAANNGNWTQATLEDQNLYLEIVQCPSNPLPKEGSNAENMAFVFNAGRHGVVDSRDSPSASDPIEKYAGMFFQDGNPNSSADLTAGDGAVNTLLISENLTGSRWINMTESTVGFTWNLPNPTDATANGINRHKTTAGLAPTSNHPGVVNVAFADAHVRTINEAISYVVYAQLCTPNGTRFAGTSAAMPLLSEGDIY